MKSQQNKKWHMKDRKMWKTQNQLFENTSSSEVMYIQKYLYSGGKFQRIELIIWKCLFILLASQWIFLLFIKYLLKMK